MFSTLVTWGEFGSGVLLSCWYLKGAPSSLPNAEYFCAVQVISCCTVYSCLLPLFYIDPVGRTWKRTYGKPKPSFASNVIPELLLTVLPSMLSRYPSYVHFSPSSPSIYTFSTTSIFLSLHALFASVTYFSPHMVFISHLPNFQNTNLRS